MKLNNSKEVVEKIRLGFHHGLEAVGMVESLKADWLTLYAEHQAALEQVKVARAGLESARTALATSNEDGTDNLGVAYEILNEALATLDGATLSKGERPIGPLPAAPERRG